MNRCDTKPLNPPERTKLWALSTLLGSLLLMQVGHSHAQLRNFPPDTKRGVLVVTVPPQVSLDGKPDRLSPGTRIRQPNNLIVMSDTLVGQELTVNYTRDAAGSLRDVWILTADEAKQRLAAKP